jgi:hypothetical protein
MSDFTQDDLFDAVEKVVRQTLARGDVHQPPVDALDLAQHLFGFTVDYADPVDDEDEEPGRYGPRPRPRRRPPPDTILLRPDQSDESQQMVAARAVAGRLVPEVLQSLGIAPGTESKQGRAQLVGLVTSHLLLPTRWFATDARKAGFDLLEVKDKYPTVGYETLALRMLDVADDPMVIAIVDDGVVAVRRANRFPVTKKLTEAEQRVVERVAEADGPARVRADGWTAWGWPTPGIPFRRIVVRAAPDEV